MSSEARSTQRLPALVLGVLAALGLALYAYHCDLYARYTNDDAYITFRYSRFLALGRGPYFNPGEHVEGYTNLLLMLISAPVIAVFGPDAAALSAKGLGVVCGAAALLLALAIGWQLALASGASRLRAALVGATALGMIAADAEYGLNAMSGLETLLFAACVTSGVALGLRELASARVLGSGIAFGLAALTRPEGAFLFGVFWTASALGHFAAARRVPREPSWPRVRVLLASLGVVLTVLVAQLTFRQLAYDGEWLPNTYYAKQGGFAKVPVPLYVAQALRSSVLGWLGLALGALGLCFARLPLPLLVPVAAFDLAALSLPMLAGSDWMLGSRLLVPYLPVIAASVVLGWSALLVRVTRREGAAVALLALVPLSFSLQAPQRADYQNHIELRALGYQTGHRALGRHLAQEALAGESVALMDIGIVGYEAIDQVIVDITGLTDRAIAKSPGPFLEKSYDLGLVLDREPRFIVLVLAAPGRSFEPPPPNTRFQLWTRIEQRLFQDPRFQAHYVHQRSPAPGAHWLERVAASTGALRVFPHAHPGSYYLLALFERRASKSVDEVTAVE